MDWRRIAVAMMLCGAAGSAGAVGRLADLTLYDRAENRTLPVYHHDGRYYVVGRPGNEYQIRVRNRTGADLLAVVSVDGVNAINGETAHWSQTGYVLGPRQAHDIRGWRKSLRRVAAFYFTEHSSSYAARTGRPDNVGVVGVALFRRKSEPEARIEQSPPRPDPFAPDRRDESPDPAGAAARSAESAAGARIVPLPRQSPSLGTGHGRSVTSHASYTRFERLTAVPEEVIAIHYDTRANLVAMGVIRAPRIAAPFPGHFVPDPW